MIRMTPEVLKKHVIESLNTASENGYEDLMDFRDIDIANDLLDYDGEVEAHQPEEFLPAIKEWRKSKITKFVCDDARHLICLPFSEENLHSMAETLGIKRCWFHRTDRFPHYDIPKTRIEEIKAKCEIVTTREIVKIINQAREL